MGMGLSLGLPLAPSKGVGVVNIVPNGDFEQGSSGWVAAAGVSFSGGNCVFTAVSSASGIDRSDLVFTPGASYVAKVVISAYTAGDLRTDLGSAGLLTFGITAPGIYERAITAGGTNTVVRLYATGATTCTIQSFSIRPA